MGADVPQAVHLAGLGRIAPPLALLAAPVVLIVEPALGILRHNGTDGADLPRPDQIPDVLGGDMAGVGIGHHEQQALLPGQPCQLLPLGAVHRQGFIAGHMNARLQKGLADLVVGHIGGDHHHEIDAVLPGTLRAGHLLVVGIAPLRVQPQGLPLGPALLRTAGEAARHQSGGAVQSDGPPVGVSDERSRPSAYHSIGQCSAHAVNLLRVMCVRGTFASGPLWFYYTCPARLFPG